MIYLQIPFQPEREPYLTETTAQSNTGQRIPRPGGWPNSVFIVRVRTLCNRPFLDPFHSRTSFESDVK
jgi:hypothetical protein